MYQTWIYTTVIQFDDIKKKKKKIFSVASSQLYNSCIAVYRINKYNKKMVWTYNLCNIF